MFVTGGRERPPSRRRVQKTPAGRILRRNAKNAATSTGRFQVDMRALRTEKSSKSPLDIQKKDARALIARLKSVLSNEMSGKKITLPKNNGKDDDPGKVDQLMKISFLLYFEQFFDTALERTESKTAGDFATLLIALDVTVRLLEGNYFSKEVNGENGLDYNFQTSVKPSMDNCATMCGIPSLNFVSAVDEHVAAARKQYVTYLG